MRQPPRGQSPANRGPRGPAPDRGPERAPERGAGTGGLTPRWAVDENTGLDRAVDRVAGQRRAQANLLPPTTRRGDPIIAEVLFEALEDASNTDALASPYPHGFHSWPAGMHPAIAATVLSGLLPLVPQGGVVDPFAGGGTVGLESLLHDRPFVGTDLNPLSRLVGGERCRPRSLTQVQAVATILAGVVERSKDRVRKKQPSRADVSPEIARQYAPHTLMELAGLLAEIDAVPKDRAEGIRSTLAVGFSAILTKVSNRRGDTDGKAGALKPGGADVEVADDFGKRVGRFIPTERFEAKVHELLDKQQALYDVVGDDILPITFVTADARDLPEVLGQKRASLILTSPPYGGTYDYTHHHAHRLAFLGLDAGTEAQSFDRRELFARRRANPSAFDDETKQMLASLAEVLHDDGLCVLVVGDAQMGSTRIDAAAHLETLVQAAGLEVVAVSSAPRPDFLGGRERMEHLVCLRRR